MPSATYTASGISSTNIQVGSMDLAVDVNIVSPVVTMEIVSGSYIKRRKAAFRCVRCSSPETVNSVVCRDCWFRDKASHHLGSTSRVFELLDLWEQQDGKCFYSGEPLTPGENASIDHQTPKSRGGEDDIANYKWVSHRVNLMKTDMTHPEFISFCKHIIEYMGGT